MYLEAVLPKQVQLVRLLLDAWMCEDTSTRGVKRMWLVHHLFTPFVYTYTHKPWTHIPAALGSHRQQDAAGACPLPGRAEVTQARGRPGGTTGRVGDGADGGGVVVRPYPVEVVFKEFLSWCCVCALVWW